MDQNSKLTQNDCAKLNFTFEEKLLFENFNPNSLEIYESNEWFYHLNIVIIITGFVFILIYFCYDLFSIEDNNLNNIEYNNLSNTDNKNLYIFRTR